VAAPSSADASLPERLKLVRPLGARGSQTWAAVEILPDGKARVAVVEKVQRGAGQVDTDIADWIRDARRLTSLEHPNLARVRDVTVRGDEVLVTGDYIDGVRWSELGAAAAKPALETALRVLVDVLTGLSAMHNLRDENREPVKLVHGHLTPDHVIVGLDGTAKLVLPCRSRGDGLQTERAGSAYLAPEILLGDESADARADLYGVGAMLWEALCGKPLFAGLQPSAIVTQLLSGRVPKATVPAGSPWAAGLVDVAARAMSADPEKRFASAAAMTAEVRRIAGLKLPPAMRVAAYVRGAHGDAIKARREAIERGEIPVVLESDAPPSFDAEVTLDVDSRVTGVPGEEPKPNATTRPPPPADAAPPVVIPPAPPAPKDAPALRSRQATVAGVAPVGPPPLPVSDPPAPEPVRAGPPPLPKMAMPDTVPLAFVPPPVPPAFDVPRLAPVHDDLVQEVAKEMRSAMLEPPAASPVPAMPPMVTPLDEPKPAAPVQRKRVPVVLIAVPAAVAAFAAAFVIWWLASRTPEQAQVTAPPAASSATVVAAPPPPEPTPTVVASAAPTPAPEPVAPVVSAAPPTPPEPPAAETSTATAQPQLPVAPVPAPARPPPRPRYEPEGI
jgi:hypothetical protein